MQSPEWSAPPPQEPTPAAAAAVAAPAAAPAAPPADPPAPRKPPTPPPPPREPPLNRPSLSLPRDVQGDLDTDDLKATARQNLLSGLQSGDLERNMEKRLS